ncbi:hypothetical protein T10_7189 [Trichinella papuae]|uniref:Uncharacterized protein n=1 Tax=Trichinella papuae TaxID=268474 RepID=A0A0V1N655_9BILA|nr:hypothetical protein T10_7189 [Trichinella papuae]
MGVDLHSRGRSSVDSADPGGRIREGSWILKDAILACRGPTWLCGHFGGKLAFPTIIFVHQNDVYDDGS